MKPELMLSIEQPGFMRTEMTASVGFDKFYEDGGGEIRLNSFYLCGEDVLFFLFLNSAGTLADVEIHSCYACRGCEVSQGLHPRL